MAIHTSSAIIGAISGKLGGTTFVHNAKGAVVRASARKPPYGTAAQRDQAASMQRARLRWQIITQAQRDGWEAISSAYAPRDRLSRRHRLSGFQLFMKVNGISEKFDGTLYDTAPANLNLLALTTGSISVTFPGIINLFFTNPPGPPGHEMDIWAARPISTSVTKTFRRWQACGSFVLAAPPVNIFGIITNIIGIPQRTERLGVRASIRIPGGLRGPFQEFNIEYD